MAEATEGITTESSAAADRPRVLVAEDHTAMRVLVAETLREAGYEVVEVRDGAELVEHLVGARGRGGERLDAVVSDARMPRVSGLEALREMRLRGASTPFILITAFADRVTREEAMRWGAAYVLDKPFELQVLRDAVRAVTSARGER